MRSRSAVLREQQYRLAVADPHPRIALLERQVAELRWRVADLEAQRGAPVALRAHNAALQAASERLRSAIAGILTERPDATGKECLRALERLAWSPLPSVRTVQRHMDTLRQRQTPRGVLNSGARRQDL
jgi:hypothetical protein